MTARNEYWGASTVAEMAYVKSVREIGERW